eukprot:CAMPEP_0205833682 /NCGR_PEP_ID=MMETSP0206-20130828/50181_1 /ASSEMBLY_ACC=CAM_ASM_000279 /TAXON_ID=36767 /ORGANISM="Euplotes focardii, Strain TN1" /LENGTH=426 /DNA_ID=CAMNT_0053140291 /DNA_START=585 /DNA_END=1861 /DNA_ORIENTATION=-
MISNALSTGMGGAQVKSWIDVPSANNSTFSAGAWIMIFVIAAIVLLWIAGIVLTNTSIGDKVAYREESEASPKIQERKALWALSFISFNPVENMKKIFMVNSRGDNTLAVLNGVRVFSISWVIAGHAFGSPMVGPVTNLSSIKNIFNDASFRFIAGGVYAVDTFFWLSGFLTFALLTSKMYPKKGNIGAKNFLMLYFHRYYRLVIPVAFVQFFFMGLMGYLGNGPLYESGMQEFQKPCNTYWWSNLLFVNNFLPWDMNNSCIGWVWYLANDMQFFIVSPFLIYLYCKNRRVAYILLFTLIIISMATNGIFTLIKDVSPMIAADNFNAQSWMYTKPWSRMGPYFVGAIFGFSYFELTRQDDFMELRNTTFNKIYKILKDSQYFSVGSMIIGLGFTSIVVFPIGSFNQQCGFGDDPQKGANCWAPFPS